MKPLLPCLAACAVGAGLSLAISGAATAQPSALPPPDTNSASPTGQNAPPEADNLINGDFSLKQREDRLAALLSSSLADGSLSKAEYSRANAELATIRAAENRMRQRNHGELTDTDTFRLEGHIKALIGSIRWKS
jgi:hypothetical protein